jgi:hypothetical protein
MLELPLNPDLRYQQNHPRLQQNLPRRFSVAACDNEVELSEGVEEPEEVASQYEENLANESELINQQEEEEERDDILNQNENLLNQRAQVVEEVATNLPPAQHNDIDEPGRSYLTRCCRKTGKYSA